MKKPTETENDIDEIINNNNKRKKKKDVAVDEIHAVELTNGKTNKYDQMMDTDILEESSKKSKDKKKKRKEVAEIQENVDLTEEKLSKKLKKCEGKDSDAIVVEDISTLGKSIKNNDNNKRKKGNVNSILNVLFNDNYNGIQHFLKKGVQMSIVKFLNKIFNFNIKNISPILLALRIELEKKLLTKNEIFKVKNSIITLREVLTKDEDISTNNRKRKQKDTYIIPEKKPKLNNEIEININKKISSDNAAINKVNKILDALLHNKLIGLKTVFGDTNYMKFEKFLEKLFHFDISNTEPVLKCLKNALKKKLVGKNTTFIVRKNVIRRISKTKKKLKLTDNKIKINSNNSKGNSVVQIQVGNTNKKLNKKMKNKTVEKELAKTVKKPRWRHSTEQLVKKTETE